MAKNETDGGNKHKHLRTIIKLAMVALGAIAIYQELQKPAEERQWHGAVAGLVPYDFRPPTVSRIKERLWNPEGSIFSRQVVGVGWTVNFGAVWKKIQELIGR